MLIKILIRKIKNLLNWLINKFRKVKSSSIQVKLQQMEKERDMPGHYGKKGKGKSAKMKKQAATAIAMKKAGKKPKKKDEITKKVSRHPHLFLFCFQVLLQ